MRTSVASASAASGRRSCSSGVIGCCTDGLSWVCGAVSGGRNCGVAGLSFAPGFEEMERHDVSMWAGDTCVLY